MDQQHDASQEEQDLRAKLIELSAEGRIREKKKQLAEAHYETLVRIHRHYNAEQLDQLNGQLADMLIPKFSELLEQAELIVDAYKLERDLSKNDLLKKDIKTILCFVTPHVPYIGLLSGGITVASHIAECNFSGGNPERPMKDPPDVVFDEVDTPKPAAE